MNRAIEYNYDIPWWQNRKIWMITGIVVVVLLAIFIAFRVSNLKTLDPRALPFTIQLHDVTGIHIGTPITYKGKVIGEVFDASIDETGQPAIKALVYPEFTTIIRTGSVFEKKTVEVTGVGVQSSIDVTVYNDTSPSLKKNAVVVGAVDQVEAFTQMVKILGPDMATKYFQLGNYNVTTRFSHENVFRSFILESGLIIPQDLFFSSILPSDAKWFRTQPSTARTRVIKVEGEFASAEEAQWNKSALHWQVNPSLFWTDYSYTEEFPSGAFLAAGSVQIENKSTEDLLTELTACYAVPQSCVAVIVSCVSDVPACIERIKSTITIILGPLENILTMAQGVPVQNLAVHYTVEMPGVIESYAPINGELQGNSVTWNMTGGEINQGLILSVTSREYNAISISITVLVLIAIIVFAVFMINRRRAMLGD